jgi:riboflavin kinase / FMN adenylyltransferase
MAPNHEKPKSLIPPTLFAGKPKTEPMARVYSADDWIERFHKAGSKRKTTVVTIGNFDGVHLGHQAILRAAWELAGQSDGISVALTFFPHPTKFLRPADAPPLIMTLEQRLAAIEALEIDATLVLRFDEKLARLSPKEFVKEYLSKTLRTRDVVYGENFRFGYQKAGDASTLNDMGIDLYPCAPVKVDALVVSSTAIRNAIAEGRVDDAKRMLGRPFALEGEIKPGTGQGRKLVVPTLNLSTEQELLPKNGVYATESVVAGKTYRAATNVGTRPTFDGARVTIESFLFDFSDNLTGGKLEVRFWQRLRDERKFSGPAELREQVLKDIEQAKEYFRSAQLKV